MSSQGSPVTGTAALGERGPSADGERTKGTLLAGGSILGAVAMSSCCIVPLVLVSLGVTGAWIGNLSALYPYKWIFFLVTAALLGGGFYKVYRTPKETECTTDGACAAPISERITKSALWLASFLAVFALMFPYLAPMLLDA